MATASSPDTDVRAVFQRVVDLQTGRTAGFEALARGPEGSPLESPLELFAAARAEGRTAELELACQQAAVGAAAAAGLAAPLGLFVNVEPELISRATAATHLPVWEEARKRGPVVVELTERALTAHPAELLHGVDRLRELGCLIALDDVGSDPRSLALMPFLRPDIIKLDLRLVQQRPSQEIAEVVHAVLAEAERSGAAVVAEGLETDEHLETALAFGATHGQGYRFGRPEPLRLDGELSGLPAAPRAPEPIRAPTPFDLVEAAGAPIRRARKRLLVQIASRLESQAALLGAQAVLLATFEHARYFVEPARSRYERAGREAAFVAIFGEGLEVAPAPGVRGQPLHSSEPLRSVWDVAVVSPHFAACMVSRDLGDTGVPDEDRRFAFTVVYDRPLAVAAARLLMARVKPVDP